ncbi:cation:dicarboxylase symporter family transporter, partial [bacterium]|nr:cation:dicarboxylase symporter family transporter [bacterium]
MKSWRANHVLYGIVIGVISGVVCGCIFGEKMQVVEWLGTIFLNALKMAVIPLIFSSIVTGICQLGDIRKIGATGLKTVSYYFVTTGIAVLLGMVLVTVIKPGIGVEISS